MNDGFTELRAALVENGLALGSSGLSPGTSGNLSARIPRGCLITPSGMDYRRMVVADLVALTLDGQVMATVAGCRAPSSEWRCHAAVYRHRPEIGAVVHAPPPHCTALACTGRAIPAFHYMVAVAGGTDIPLVDYALFGTEELARGVVASLRTRDACLLANHGMIAVGRDLEAAFALALEVENLARQYCEAIKLGGVRLLTAAQMAGVLEQFEDYGQATRPDSPDH